MTMNNPLLNMLNPRGLPNAGTEIPPALASLMSMGTPAQPQQMPNQAMQGMGMAAANRPQQMPDQSMQGLNVAMDNRPTFIPSYQAGGMVGPGGMPAPMGAGVNPNMQAGQPMDYQMMEMNINQFMSQHPEQVQQIQQVLMQLIQSGELNQEELNMVAQLATVAAQNPEMYPYVRQFAIQQGIVTEQDLPQQYDQGLVFILLLAARAAQQAMGGQNMMQGGSPAMAGGPAVPSMAVGGKVPDSRKPDGSVLINAHEGEYVIPKNVVEMKGKEFFDNLVEKYKG
jgi:hypothetical protein